MKQRHHIYNFHIGFWGAFLITLVVMIQTALALVVGYSITLAQQQFITINEPVNNQTVNISETVNLSAITSQAVTSLSFTIKNNATGALIKNVIATGDSTRMRWTGAWKASEAGEISVTGTATNPITGQSETSSPPVLIQVIEEIQASVIMYAPKDGVQLSDSTEFRADTTGQVTEVDFVLQGTGTIQNLTAQEQVTGQWIYNFDPSTVNAGEYTLFAKADLGQIAIQSAQIKIIVSAPTQQGILNLDFPRNDDRLTGQITFKASSNTASADVKFQITKATGNPSIIGADNFDKDEKTWQAEFDTTKLANGDYSLVAYGTIDGQTVLSQTIAVSIDSQVPTGDSPVILTTEFFQATQNKTYLQEISVEGGKAPLVWSISSGALPKGLSINPSTGSISGIPTVVGTASFTVTVKDASGLVNNKTFPLIVNEATTTPPDTTEPPAEGDDTTTPEDDNADTTPPENVVPSFSITSPQADSTVRDKNVTIEMKANVAINQPSFLLVNSEGKNVLAVTDKPYLPVNNDDSKIWNLLIDSTRFESGVYTLQANTTTKAERKYLTANKINVTIENNVADSENPDATEDVFAGGQIMTPKANQSVSGKVLLQAKITGEIRSLTFTLETLRDGSKLVPATYDDSISGLWQGVWNTAGIKAGTVTVKADVVTIEGKVHTLSKVVVNLIAETAEVKPPVTTEEPAIDEIIEPVMIPNITKQGVVATTPVECQLVGITEQKKCDEYLKSRAIRLLNQQEEVQVRQDLNQFVTRHIEVGDGKAVSVDFASNKSASEQKVVEDPLGEILPIKKTGSEKTVMLIKTSTEPANNIKPFVEQTVPAILIFDKDGDGLSDEAEERYGTDFNKADTDNDGFDDGVEVKNGYNPTGTGLLSQVVSPLDLALLNNRPLDQPKFAGRIEEETLKVDQVKTSSTAPTTLGQKKMLLNGRAEAGSYVTLYIYSSLPIVVSVQADSSGNWQYELTHPLVDGKHDVYATVTNDTGKIVKKSRSFSFFVQEAEAVSEEQFLKSNVQIQDSSKAFLVYYLAGGVMIILFAGGVFFYYIRRQRTFA